MKKRLFKKAISVLLVVVLLMGSGGNLLIASASEEKSEDLPFSDIENHWAKDTLIKKYDQGMITGYPDGEFKPDKTLLRSELITLINRHFGLSEKSENNYEDVDNESTAWYVSETSIAKYFDYIDSTKAKPNEPATRADIVLMLGSLLDINGSEGETSFSDVQNLSKEQQEQFAAFKELGYLSGYGDGTVRPEDTLKRAEMLTVAENILGYIVKTQEDVEDIPEGEKVTVISNDIVIENKNIKELSISPGVTGNTLVKNTKIEKSLEIASEGKYGKITLENVEVKEVVLKPKSKETKVELLGGKETEINSIIVESSAKIVADTDIKIKDVNIVGKEINPILENLEVTRTLIIDGEGTNLNLYNNEVNKLEINSEGSTVALEDTKVDDIKVNNKAIIETDEETKIYEIVISDEAEIKGEGYIKEAYISSDGVVLEESPKYVKVGRNVESADIAGKETTSKNDSHKPRTAKVETPEVPVNTPPIVVNPIDDINDAKIETLIDLDITNVFSDADGDALILVSDVGSIETVSESKYFRYTPTKEEIISVKITATDTSGESVVDTFKVTVPEPVIEDGTDEHPFLIKTINDLANIGNVEDGWNVYASYKLVNDLDFENPSSYDKGEVINSYITDKGWKPIYNFRGTFDGNGHTISNLYINRPTEDECGLIGWNDGIVKSLGLLNVNVMGKYYVGSITGKNYGTVTRSDSTGNVTGRAFTGGLVGENKGDVRNSYSKVNVDGGEEHSLGGLVGQNFKNISNSYATGNVTIIGLITGGLVGTNLKDGTINNSYATGEIFGANLVAGLVGNNLNANIEGIKDNVAFNSKISGKNRVVFSMPGSNNYANSKMLVDGACVTDDVEAPENTTNGKGISAEQFKNIDTYKGGFLDAWQITGEEDAVWEIKPGADRPTLIGVGDDDGKIITPDTTAPTVIEFCPADDNTDVEIDSELKIIFSENITVVRGKQIKISQIFGDIDIPVDDEQVTISDNIVTIKIDIGLLYDRDYTVTIDSGAFKDSSDNYYEGISDSETWNFSTKPGWGEEPGSGEDKGFF